MQYVPVPHSAVFAPGSLARYKYVVMFAQYQGKWLFCRHKKRSTIETAGGHIEPGETPLQAAKRELWEETGAAKFNIHELFDYAAEDNEGAATSMALTAWFFLLRLKSLGNFRQISRWPKESCLTGCRMGQTCGRIPRLFLN